MLGTRRRKAQRGKKHGVKATHVALAVIAVLAAVVAVVFAALHFTTDSGSKSAVVDATLRLRTGATRERREADQLSEPLDTGVWIRVHVDTVCSLDHQYQP